MSQQIFLMAVGHATSVLRGLIETYGYVWYSTPTWAPVYNTVIIRQSRTSRPMVSGHVRR